MESSDAEIVRRIRAGDVGAYRIIVDRYYERCLRFCLRMLSNRADAEEVVQDVFARAYRYLGGYDEGRAVGPWLMQVAVNEVRTSLARRRRRDAPLVSLDLAVDFAAPEHTLDVHVAADVQRALELLDPDQRELVVLKYVNDLTYEAMSEIVGLPVPTLKMRIARARQRMEALLERWDDA